MALFMDDFPLKPPLTGDEYFTEISGWWYTYPSEKYESQLG